MNLFALVVLLAATSTAKADSVNSIRNSETRQFNYTTVFTRVVPSNDLSNHDAIFITPSVMFLGKSNGDILRCLLKDPSVCELFYSYSSSVGVTAIAINGEYLYASLASGVMLKCKLHEKSCDTFYLGTCAMNSLVVAGGYIHAGMQDGRMLRCELNKPNCKVFNWFPNGIASLAATEKYVYAALDNQDNSEIWRCSIASENSCRVINRRSSYSKINGMFAVEESVIGITQGGTLWNCTHGNPCISNSRRECTSMAVFDRSLYILHVSNITICDWNETCSFFDQNEGAISIALAHSTYRMQERYVNEEKTCLSAARCPPLLSYYEANERPMLEVFVRGGKLYNSQGVLVDTKDADVGHSGRAAIFAMSPDGQLLLSNVHNSILRTSSLFAGQPVSGAGEIVVEDGVIKSIRACSDHYRPDVELNGQVVSVLNIKGYTARIESLPCSVQHRRDSILAADLNGCGQMGVDENMIGGIGGD